MKTISIVAPNGVRIADGIKTIEVRSWTPEVSPDEDLLIVENKRYLKVEGDVDPDGYAVAVVRVAKVRTFDRKDISAACATSFAEGYYSWELTHVRKLQNPFPVVARRGIYETDFSFRPLNRQDFSILQKWLAEPHVREWWHDDLNAEEIEARYGPRVDGTEPTHVYIIIKDTKPIGIIQWYLWSDYPDHAAQLGADGTAAGIDLAIGEKESLGNGLGPKIIREFVNRVVFAKSNATTVVTDPEEQNSRSLQAFKKAGFNPLRTTQLQGESFKRIVVGLQKDFGHV